MGSLDKLQFDTITDEQKLSCELLECRDVKDFMIAVFYRICITIRRFGVVSFDQFKRFIEPYFFDGAPRTLSGKPMKYVAKPGIFCYGGICDRLYDVPAFPVFRDILVQYDVHNIMGAIYKFTTLPDIYETAADNDQFIQEEVIKNFRDMFSLPESYTYGELNKFGGTKKYVIMDAIIKYNIDYRAKHSLTRYITSNRQYIRKTVPHEELVVNDHTTEYLDRKSCHYGMIENVYRSDPTKTVAMVKSNYSYSLDNSVFSNLCRRYGRPVIAGPSTSSVIMFNFVFKILKMPLTTLTYFYLLCAIISDYVPMFNSLTEILLTYTREGNLIKPYNNIEDDPIVFFKNLYKLVNNTYEFMSINVNNLL